MDSGLVKQLRNAIKERNWGSNGSIYLLGDDKLAKGKSKQSSEAEYKWGSYLYEQGVQVPEMYGLVRPDSLLLRPSYETPIEDWFVVIQKIDGRDIRDMSIPIQREVLRKYYQEIEKVLELGIYPSCDALSGNNNAVIDKDGKLYLLDFEYWRKGSEGELEWLYEQLRTYFPRR